MFTRIFAVLICSIAPVSLWAQADVWLRDSGMQFTVTGVTTVSSTAQIATFVAHGLSAANSVVIYNVCGATGVNVSVANPSYLVRAVQDSTHFTIETQAHGNVAPGGSWCTGGTIGIPSGGPQWGGKATHYTLPLGPKGGMFDGWNGRLTRLLTIRPANGMVSLASTSNVVTMVTSFNPDLAVGDNVGIWGTSSAALNDSGNPWTVASKTVGSPNTTITFTSGTAGTVTNGTYTTNNACGSGGTSNCVSVSERGWHGNKFWDASAGFDLLSACSEATFYTYNTDLLKSCAVKTLINPANTTGVAGAGFSVEFLKGIEHYIANTGGALWADETHANAGNDYFSDFGSYSMYDAGLMFAAFQDYLTAPQQQHVADVMLNDIRDAGGCTKNVMALAGGTVTLSSSTSLLGSGTHFTTDLTVGDILLSVSYAGYSVPASITSIVTAITDDTHLTMTAAAIPTFDGTPQQLFHAHGWSSGMCGALWAKKYWDASTDSHPVDYPPRAGNGAYPPPYGFGLANNVFTEGWGLMSAGSALADVDPRGALLFQREQAWWFDKQFIPTLQYNTGFASAGSGYSFFRNVYEAPLAAEHLKDLVPGYTADLGLNEIWMKNHLIQVMYNVLPDKFVNGGSCFGAESMIAYGRDGGDGCFSSNTANTPFMNQSTQLGLNRTDTVSKLWFDWLSVRGFDAAWMNKIYSDRFMLEMDPRLTRTDYTTQPLQYGFIKNNQALCQSLTGGSCSTVRGDAITSRTSWTATSATLALYLSKSNISGDHDLPEMGVLRLYKAGYLMWRDGGNSTIPDTQDTMLNLSAGTARYTVALSYDPATSLIARWGSPTADPYGDASSRYVYGMSDLSTIYTTPPNYAQRHFIDLKKSGTEQIILQIDKTDASNLGGSANTRVHYWQNGQAGEGNTTCPGGGGCGSLDASRDILSQEANTGTSLYGMRTHILSPGTITVTDDGSAFSGATGATHRISICGGASCGSSPILKSVIVHRVDTIASGLTLTTSAPLSDSTHYVVRADDKIVGMSTDDSLVSGYPSHTIPSGITQALYVDMAPGTYSATIGGSCTVVANDNTCYLEPGGAGGTMTITAGAGTSPTITTSSLPNGANGVAYSQTLTATGDIPITWSITVGSLPAWASLNTSTGAITGTPNAVATTSFTVTATNATGSDSKALSITIVAASTAGSVVRATGVRGTIIK